MVHREHLRNFLRINGISTTAPDSEIRNALLYARWHESDVEYAILTLRGENTDDVRLSASHGVLHTDERLSAVTLTALLGIDIDLSTDRFMGHSFEERIEKKSKPARSILLVSISVLVALLVALLLMSFLNIGPYYSPLEQSLL